MYVCRGRYGSVTQTILIDTGASHSVISERAAQSGGLVLNHITDLFRRYSPPVTTN